MEKAKPMVRRLMSLITELRVDPKTSHADGMIYFTELLRRSPMDMQVLEAA